MCIRDRCVCVINLTPNCVVCMGFSPMGKMSSGEKTRQARHDEGNLFGRDALFHLSKKKCPKSHPSKNGTEAWLGKQELQHLHKQTRKDGATGRFRPSKPWGNISMDSIDCSGGGGTERQEVHSGGD